MTSDEVTSLVALATSKEASDRMPRPVLPTSAAATLAIVRDPAPSAASSGKKTKWVMLKGAAAERNAVFATGHSSELSLQNSNRRVRRGGTVAL